MTTTRLFACTVAAAIVAGVAVPAVSAAPKRKGDRVVANAKTAIVKTAYGEVRGFIHDGIYNYKGIQYAHAERFMQPEPPESWRA